MLPKGKCFTTTPGRGVHVRSVGCAFRPVKKKGNTERETKKKKKKNPVDNDVSDGSGGAVICFRGTSESFSARDSQLLLNTRRV